MHVILAVLDGVRVLSLEVLSDFNSASESRALKPLARDSTKEGSMLGPAGSYPNIVMPVNGFCQAGAAEPSPDKQNCWAMAVLRKKVFQLTYQNKIKAT